MATLKLFFAWTLASWRRYTTLYWWFKLCYPTWTPHRLDRNHLARLAKSKMAKVFTMMLATR